MDNVTNKTISILFLILWFIFYLTYFNTQYKSKQEQKRLKQKPILKATLVCSNKIVDLDVIYMLVILLLKKDIFILNSRKNAFYVLFL